MTIAEQAADMEANLKTSGVGIVAFCAEVGVDHATFWRWKKGTSTPLMDTWNRVVRAYEERMSGAAAE